MEGHYPVPPLELHHDDLHVWLFEENPARLFSHSNPDVNCDSPWGYPVVEKVTKIVPHK